MYVWRKMTDKQRAEVLRLRRQCRRPLHSPPHFDVEGWAYFHLSAANFEHRPILGASAERMHDFSKALCRLFDGNDTPLYAWCILPNHWHALVRTTSLSMLMKEIGKLHGKYSHTWNGEDHLRARQCWHCCSDRRIRSEGHFCSVRNYIHHNPVKHGYVDRWQDWAFSSGRDFLEELGRGEAVRLWRTYPVLNMGDTWDLD